MAEITIVHVLVLAGLFLFAVKKVFVDRKKLAKLPPGPKALPLVGNIRDLPPDGMQEWRHWLKAKDAHGPISSVTVLGQTIVILHDQKAAYELMEKRSAIYSSRPHMEFADEMYYDF